MARALCVLACFMVVAGAAPLEKFFPRFVDGDNSVGAVDASHGASRTAALTKNVEVTIKKEIVKNPASPALVVSTTATPPPAHVHAHAHHHAAAATPAPPPPPPPTPVLDLNAGPVLIDNATISGILQQLLAGNIQNVQAHGQPLAVPLGGKPVAVVFSAAIHILDLGDLRPPVHVTTERPAHGHAAHSHPPHPHINHTSILESLLQPLLSLSHIKGHALAGATAPAPSLAPALPLQPVVVMMPYPSKKASSADPVAQLEGLIQELHKAKLNILANLSVASAQALSTTPAPAPAVIQAAAPAVIPAAAPAVIHAAAPATTAAPNVHLPHIKKVKKIDITISKNVG